MISPIPPQIHLKFALGGWGLPRAHWIQRERRLPLRPASRIVYYVTVQCGSISITLALVTRQDSHIWLPSLCLNAAIEMRSSTSLGNCGAALNLTRQCVFVLWHSHKDNKFAYRIFSEWKDSKGFPLPCHLQSIFFTVGL